MELKLMLMEAKVALHRLEEDGFHNTCEALRDVIAALEQLDSASQPKQLIEAPAATRH